MSKEIVIIQTTISLDEAVRDTAKREAKKGRNSLSSYIEMLITADLKKRGVSSISNKDLNKPVQ